VAAQRTVSEQWHTYPIPQAHPDFSPEAPDVADHQLTTLAILKALFHLKLGQKLELNRNTNMGSGL
jgi:hypothetical protein